MKKLTFIFSIVLLASLVLAACGGSSSANNVTLTLTDFKVESSTTSFTQGVAYHFTVTNKGATPHEVYIMPTGGDVTASSALAGLGQADLPAGATKTFDYTFTKAYPDGSLELACHLPGHYDSGMHLPITVK